MSRTVFTQAHEKTGGFQYGPFPSEGFPGSGRSSATVPDGGPGWASLWGWRCAPPGSGVLGRPQSEHTNGKIGNAPASTRTTVFRCSNVIDPRSLWSAPDDAFTWFRSKRGPGQSFQVPQLYTADEGIEEPAESGPGTCRASSRDLALSDRAWNRPDCGPLATAAHAPATNTRDFALQEQNLAGVSVRDAPTGLWIRPDGGEDEAGSPVLRRGVG